MSKDLVRCPWGNSTPEYIAYHDNEWGRPEHRDQVLFEFLILEGAQAGLSWRTILEKRAGYRRAFADFDPQKVARFSDAKLEKLLLDPGIVRNRLKVTSARNNARAFLKVQQEFGSFDAYLWGFVKGKPLINRFASMQMVPARTALSDAISKDLLKRGFKFVGSTIIYSYLQAMGVVNDHLMTCFRYGKSTPHPALSPKGRGNSK
jgi:DNA-3-methyladenine glycosylase I